jgi:hypothetical protein
MKQHFSLLISLLLVSISFGQRTLEVRELLSDKTIPFVKVLPDFGPPFLTDLDGRMTLGDSVQSITLRYHGYDDTLVRLNLVEGMIIYLEPKGQELIEVVVTAGTNPAHRIIAQAIENRKKNHPLANDAFTYNSYSKFMFDMNPEAIAAIPDSTTDSTLIQMRDYLLKQHLFLMESASKRSFIPPYRDKEEILAYKVSGFSDPMFSTFANSFQSFSFYENQFDLLGKQYINPIARGGLKRYFFLLEDTTITQSDTTFTISFRPLVNKSFDGMKGYLYINSNGYAIEKVIASPDIDSSGIVIQIVQEYEFIHNQKWFPTKLSTKIDFPSMSASPNLKNAYVQGTGSTYIADILLNPEIKKQIFNDNVTVFAGEEAGELNDAAWDSIRRYSITEKEARTYVTVDSLAKEYKFDRFLRVAKILADGQVPLGQNLNLDLKRLLRANFYEKVRFGAGFETSKTLMKPVQLGGYFGWSLGDKEWKYGGHATWHLNKRHGVRFDFRYQQDLMERGGYLFHENLPIVSVNSSRNLFITQMDRQRLGEVVFSWDIKSNLEVKLLGNYQRIWYTNGYSYLPDSRNDIDVAETGFELTWNILEKSMMLGTRKVPVGKKYPQIRIKAVHAWKNVFESDFEYTRLNAEINHTLKVRGVGRFIWRAAGSTVIGDAPLALSYVGDGTAKPWYISVPSTFETMMPGSFYTTSQATLFTRFNFKPFATKAEWNEPAFGLHHAIGYGEFKNRENHSMNFETMEKGYFEAGIWLDGILTNKYSSIGLGGFYKYGAYADPDWKKNIVPKIVMSMRF